MVNIGGGGFYDFLKLGEVHIIKNRVYFNVAIGAIFFSGGVSFVLFVVQIRKKYVDHDNGSSSQGSSHGPEDPEARVNQLLFLTHIISIYFFSSYNNIFREVVKKTRIF